MIKVSLRSVGAFPCNKVAAEFFQWRWSSECIRWGSFMEQWMKEKSHTCSILGLLLSLICLIIFGSGPFHHSRHADAPCHADLSPGASDQRR